jgi:hypothetical protein
MLGSSLYACRGNEARSGRLRRPIALSSIVKPVNGYVGAAQPRRPGGATFIHLSAEARYAVRSRTHGAQPLPSTFTVGADPMTGRSRYLDFHSRAVARPRSVFSLP